MINLGLTRSDAPLRSIHAIRHGGVVPQAGTLLGDREGQQRTEVLAGGQVLSGGVARDADVGGDCFQPIAPTMVRTDRCAPEVSSLP
ncbi:MAG: hypothetical protein WAN48_14045 [Actinomycetes bacterium]